MNNELTIHCGSVDDSFGTLKKKCEAEAAKLCTTIQLSKDSITEIPFWTSDFPELICVGKFSLADDGSVKYELDYSECTL